MPLGMARAINFSSELPYALNVRYGRTSWNLDFEPLVSDGESDLDILLERARTVMIESRVRYESLLKPQEAVPSKSQARNVGSKFKFRVEVHVETFEDRIELPAQLRRDAATFYSTESARVNF